jgi:hypothetical protein
MDAMFARGGALAKEELTRGEVSNGGLKRAEEKGSGEK